MSVWAAGGITPTGFAERLHPGYGSGNFSVMWEGSVVGNIAMAAVDLVYVYPFRVYSPIVITSLFQRCETAGAGSSVKSAVWANNYATARPTGLPLLGQNAGFDTSGTGVKTAAISNIRLLPGIYWGGSKATGTLPMMTQINAADSSGSVAAPSAQMGTSVQPVGFSAPSAYANDIMTLDLTGATFTLVSASRIPVIGLGWA